MLESAHYRITPKNILVHEMIGIDVSANMARKTLRGKVVDETRNTFRLETKSGEEIVPKKGTLFEFDLSGENAVVDGKKILHRPEQRIKALWRNQ